MLGIHFKLYCLDSRTKFFILNFIDLWSVMTDEIWISISFYSKYLCRKKFIWVNTSNMGVEIFYCGLHIIIMCSEYRCPTAEYNFSFGKRRSELQQSDRTLLDLANREDKNSKTSYWTSSRTKFSQL